MSRAVIVYILLVLAPSGALAFRAYRVADWDHRARIEEARLRVREEAAALARRIETALSDAARRSENDAVTGYARDGRWIGYALDAPADESEPKPGAEDLQRYRLSMRGGESFELATKDPARALDAYSFYAPRIRSPALRARLQLAAARSALAAGETRLGVELLGALAAGAERIETEEGLPIDLVAGCRLIALHLDDEPRVRVATLERLRMAATRLPTPLLARFVREIAPGDAPLANVIRQRRALECAVAAHPEILSSASAVLAVPTLLLVRPGRVPAVREIRLATIDELPVDAGGLGVRLEPPGSIEGTASREGEAVHPVRLDKDGPVLATLRVNDPRLGEKIADADRQRDVNRAFVGLLVLVTLAGGAALSVYLARERRLAKLRARLLANVSHELKTPITSIRMFSELLAEDGSDAEKTRRFGRLLSAESSRLSQLVENLLDFTRLGKKQQSLALEPVDLSALLRRVADGFEIQAREKQVAFRVDGIAATGENAPAIFIETNAAAVERIVLNLLDNALKYRRKAAPEIRLALIRNGNAARVSILDNGIGIPRRDHERVFEELYRVRYDDYAVKGSGLGLSIARRLAQKLGGDIALESREDVGSTFTLTLPAKGLDGNARTDPHR